VGKGDTVVAYMPNIPETVIALLAVASIGAIWSSCSPDFGLTSVLDRFQQIKPKVLLAVDGYQYNGKIYDRIEIVSQLQKGLPSLEKTIVVAMLKTHPWQIDLSDTILWSDFLAQAVPTEKLTFEQVPFNHPLWVLYSSGTTGLPKPIVHSHGGILLEHLKMIVLHLDLRPGDRFFWYTSTGWMMWNFLVGGLLSGATIVLYDGSPAYPDINVLWRLCDEVGITYFGTSAAFIHSCMKAGIQPNDLFDLESIKAVGSTGSPLSREGFRWVYANVNNDLALESVSGGTDLCTAFVGGCRLLPIYAGEIQCAMLGAHVQAFDEGGNSIIGEVGELVITKPMPSMPINFWGDDDEELYRASYFDTYPGIWRHGDWIMFNERGGCIIYGRSDSTINRQGIRMGTSEIYRTAESFPEIEDSLVADLELLGRESYMILFIVLSDPHKLREDLVYEIKKRIKEDISPRHVPDEIMAIEAVPYTLSGKKMEVPIRKILLGHPPESSINKGAMRNPESIQYFIDLAVTLKV
jgi:acetoacetyl-CoA synthetase